MTVLHFLLGYSVIGSICGKINRRIEIFKICRKQVLKFTFKYRKTEM